MTTFKEHSPTSKSQTDATEKTETAGKFTLAEVLEILSGGRLPLRFTAYDGSSAGPPDAAFGLDLRSPRGTSYLATGRGDLGFARAYIAGDLDIRGVHPGDPYELLKALAESLVFTRPPVRMMVDIIRSIGARHLRPVAPPPQETQPRWRRISGGLRHSKTRDADVVHHHYDVSNTFYEWVLGPSMTYTCACYPRGDASLDQAQDNKYRLVFEKLRLRPGDRLLDVGCGWGGMVRYAARRGVRATGVTLSTEQAGWAQRAIADEGLSDLAEVLHGDYRDITDAGYDAVSSIGLLEHIGVRNYPSYFGFLQSRLRPGGLLLNHSITWPENQKPPAGRGFIDRYVFPDGELAGLGRIIGDAQDTGLEVVHEENLRQHYAMTLRDWCANLVEHWDEAVAEVGLPTAKVWGLYMAGSRLGFESNGIQLHQVLLTRPDNHDGADTLPLRPWWTP